VSELRMLQRKEVMPMRHSRRVEAAVQCFPCARAGLDGAIRRGREGVPGPGVRGQPEMRQA
jgi:hypothetical protein